MSNSGEFGSAFAAIGEGLRPPPPLAFALTYCIWNNLCYDPGIGLCWACCVSPSRTAERRGQRLRIVVSAYSRELESQGATDEETKAGPPSRTSGKARPASGDQPRYPASPPHPHPLGAVCRALGETLGLIIRPNCCIWCRRRRRLQRHHWDYAEPLNVSFLCPDCHALADMMVTRAQSA